MFLQETTFWARCALIYPDVPELALPSHVQDLCAETIALSLSVKGDFSAPSVHAVEANCSASPSNACQ